MKYFFINKAKVALAKIKENSVDKGTLMKSNTAIYDWGVKYKNAFSNIRLCFLRFISPTFWYADNVKKGLSPEDRMKGIVGRNYSYLLVAIFFTLVFGVTFASGALDDIPIWLNILIILFLYLVPLSRCNEIFIAFIKDALDKSENKSCSSTLSYRKRIELALLSYCELILNYSIIYLLMPSSWFSKGLESIFDSIYFSGVTITTLGYGDYSPTHWLPKMLVIHEVLAGFTLIIVSFALYVGKTPNAKLTD